MDAVAVHETVSVRIGRTRVEVDVGIASLVEAVNRRRIRTQGACERDHVFVGEHCVWSDHAYVSFETGADAAAFVERGAAVIDPQYVFSEVTTLIGRGNGYPSTWNVDRLYPLPDIAQSWVYGAVPWTTQNRGYTGMTVLIAFPTAHIAALTDAFNKNW